MKRIFIGLLILAAMTVAIWSAVNWHHLRAFPTILSSWYAKEFCSCHFVVGRDEAFCHNVARQWLDISEFKLDKSAKTVTVTGLAHTNTARYHGPRVGCTLDIP